MTSVTALQAVIFDLDGLLADTEPLHYASWNDVIKSEFGLDVSWDEYADHFIRRGLSIPEFMAQYRIVRDPKELWQLRSRRYLALVESDLRPMPGALDLLERLHSRVSLALASSSWQRHVEAVLRKLGATEFFDVIATGEMTPRVKPHPDIFLCTADRLHLEPTSCVVLEDAEKGVLAAAAAGMASVAVPTPHTRTHDFSSASAVVGSLEEVTLEMLAEVLFLTRPPEAAGS